MSGRNLDWPLKNAKSCPARVEANADAKGYYLVEYKGGLLSALTGGGAASGLGAPERLDLIGDVEMISGGGKIPASDALGLVQVFHNDPERDVLQRALGVAVSIHENFVPPSLEPNYRRFLLKNFRARARELGWMSAAGESEDVRLLRPQLVSAIATSGGDQDLAKEARSLTDKWLQDHSGIPPEVLGAVLDTAAYDGDLDLFNRFLAAYRKTGDRQEQRRLINAMRSFHDRAAIQAGFEAVLTKQMPLEAGFTLLVSAGQGFSDTRKLPFEFIQAHFDQIVSGHPNIFGNDLGAFLPYSGQSFCDPESRNELQAFFGPLVDKYQGAPRNLAQVLEGIDLCVARKAAQAPSVASFLEKY
jgi:alanyl aminopeptidase